MRARTSARVVLLSKETEQARRLKAELAQNGIDCLVIPDNARTLEGALSQQRGVVLLDTDGGRCASEAWELARRMKQRGKMSVIALVDREQLNGSDFSTSVDDFVVKPCQVGEVMARIKRILRQKEMADSRDVILCGDLVIDSAKCEVSLCGRPIVLTFKEYQLLSFLAVNKGKVFTRDELLDKVWGWDYYGGDRTVDVHIRRLRSKIEGPTHTFIETVRNIGYKFREF